MTSPEGRPMRVGSDLDDVLIATAPLCIEMYNQAHQTSLTLDNWYTADHHMPPWGVEVVEDAYDRVNVILGSDEFVQSVEPVPGGPRAMARIKEIAELLDGITGRPPSIKEATLQAVERDYPGLFSEDNVDFTHFISRNHKVQKISKVVIAHAKGMTHFGEDLPHHANDLVESGVRTGLFGFSVYPWTQPGVYFGHVRELHPDLVLLGDMDAYAEWMEDEAKLFASLAPDEMPPMDYGRKRY